MMSNLVVLLRDVAPSTWGGSQRVLAAVRAVANVPVTLLVVPRLRGQGHDLRFDEALSRRLSLGDELALHGYMHEENTPVRGTLDALRRRWLGAEEEFRSLRCDDALQRLHAGMRWFAVNGWPLSGFVAPRWSLGPGAWAALKLSPLLYTLTRHAVHVLPRDDEMPTLSIEHEAAGAIARGVSLAWNALPARLGEEAAPLLRLELTPRSADHPAVRRAWQRCLRRHLAWRQVQTMARVVQAMPAGEPVLHRAGDRLVPRPSVRA